MATKQVMVCDVCKACSSRNVRSYLVTVQLPAEDGANLQYELDACPTAFKRLKRFVEKGVGKSEA